MRLSTFSSKRDEGRGGRGGDVIPSQGKSKRWKEGVVRSSRSN